MEKCSQIVYTVHGVEFDMEIKVDIAVSMGNSSIYVLIIPGIDGSRDGYKNKYKTIAERLNHRYNATVVRMSNPHVPGGNWELNVRKVMEHIEREFNLREKLSSTMYALGFSLGGYLIGSIAYEYDFISKLLLINPASKLNRDTFFSGLQKFDGKATILLGDHGPMFKYAEELQHLGSQIVVVSGADHNFSGEHFDTFLNSPAKYLFEE